MRTLPSLKLEKELWNEGFTVIGIDEVGRGAFAGPVYVSGVALNPVSDPTEILRLEALGINDSKKLSPAKRSRISPLIQNDNLFHATAAVNSAVINDKGIMFALTSAVLSVTQELISKLPQKKVFVLLDGTDSPYKNSLLNLSYRNIVKGDSLSISIAAASIIAKVSRDEYMTTLEAEYPLYNWAKNKGYGTADHIDAIKKYGECHHHRQLYLRKLKSKLKLEV